MKKLLPIFALVILTSIASAQVSKTVNITTAGTLSALTSSYLTTVTNLTLTGKIDARDFSCMRYEMPNLVNLDISATSIVAYTGIVGSISSNTVYSANKIPQTAFFSKSGLTSVTLPVSLDSIGYNAFYGCGLISITIPPSVRSIGSQAFRSCLGLTTLTYPSVVSMGSQVFADCINLTSVNIPVSVTSIGVGAFDHCSALKSVSVSNSVTSIGWGAFRWCTGLTSVNIPVSVISIGTSAFQDCTALSAIYAYPTTPVNLSSVLEVFYDVNKTTCILYVPIGSRTAYKNSTQWKDFVNIVEKATDVEPISQKNIKIIAEKGKLTISNAELGNNVQIYSLSGLKVTEQIIESELTNIKLPKGIYVFCVGNYSDKVVIK